MSEILATSPALPDEPASVEGRLACIFVEAKEIMVEEYLLSDADRDKIVQALRLAAMVKDIVGVRR